MRRHARFLPRYAIDNLPHEGIPIPDWLERMERLGRSLTNQPLCGGNTVEPLFNGNMAYPRMIEAINRAKHHVLLTTYIFKSGLVANQFCAALIDAARRGCQVSVLVDGVGRLYSLGTPLKELRTHGVKVALFLPPSLFPPNFMINLRDHRKIMVCDDVAFTGGMNIADYHVVGKGGRHEAQDIHFELTGPIVGYMYRAFYMDWGFATGDYEQTLPKYNPAGTGSSYCRVVLDGPGSAGDDLNDLIAGSISNAVSFVWIMTPYFLPTREIMSAIRTAALKGLDVRVILPEKNNLVYVHWASQRVLEPLLQAGVRVFYQQAPFAHTKLLCVDSYYCQIGSVNYDSRSLRLNFELNTEVFDRNFCERMRLFMDETMQRKSRELQLADLKNMSLFSRLRGSLFWLFSPYL